MSLTEQDIKVLLRENLPPTIDYAWKCDDVVYLIEHYEKFLCAVAGQSDRLNKNVLVDAILGSYEISKRQGQLFADAVVAAFRHCRRKKVSDGTRTAPAILRVKEAMGLETRLPIEDRQKAETKQPNSVKQEQRSSMFDSPPPKDQPPKRARLDSPGSIHKLYHGASPTPTMRSKWAKEEVGNNNGILAPMHTRTRSL